MIIAGVMCDKCGQMIFGEHRAEQYVIKDARKKGWQIGVTRTLCPECRQKKKMEVVK